MSDNEMYFRYCVFRWTSRSLKFFSLNGDYISFSCYSYTPYYVAPEILSNDKYDKVNKKENFRLLLFIEFEFS